MNKATKMLDQDFIARAISNPLENETCQQLHIDSCNVKSMSQFVEGCKSVYKMYFLVHIIPFLLFKRKKLKENPLSEIKHFLKGFIKSLLFAGGYSMLIRRTICFVTKYYRYNEIASIAAAIAGSVTFLFEPISRQSEIALYTLNKSMEVVYLMARRRSLPVNLPYKECWLNGIAMAVICFTFLNDPHIYRESYRKGLEKFLGKV